MRHLVELHGGTVIAQSSGLGKGATFTVKLPQLEKRDSLVSIPSRQTHSGERSSTETSSHPLSAEAIDLPNCLANTRILIVDD